MLKPSHDTIMEQSMIRQMFWRRLKRISSVLLLFHSEMLLWWQEQLHRCCYWKWHLNSHTSLGFRSNLYMLLYAFIYYIYSLHQVTRFASMICLKPEPSSHGLCFFCVLQPVFECQIVYLIVRIYISTNALYLFCFSSNNFGDRCLSSAFSWGPFRLEGSH